MRPTIVISTVAASLRVSAYRERATRSRRSCWRYALGQTFTKGPDTSHIVHKACGGSVALGFHCTKCDRGIERTEIAPARLYEDRV